RVYPVVPIMHSRPGNIIMRNVPLKQQLMQILVYIVKKVARTAVNKQRKRLRRKQMQHIYNGMLFPVKGRTCVGPQALCELPVLRKGTDINSTTQTSRRTVHILIPERQIQRAMSAHTQACNGPP